jgi:hypothetical protein
MQSRMRLLDQVAVLHSFDYSCEVAALITTWRIRDDSSTEDAVGNNIETHAYKKP